jgi:hypothetical protein
LHSWLSRRQSADELVNGSKPLLDIISDIVSAAQSTSQQVPDLHEKVDVIRRFCGDDILSILNSLAALPVSPMSSIGDVKSILETMSSGSTSSASSVASDQPFSLFNFIGGVMICAEFCKELAAIMFVVHRSMTMLRDLSTDMQVNEDDTDDDADVL